MNLNFKNTITFEESQLMINMVYNTVFDTTDIGLTYLPELYDYVYRLAIAKYYGDYEITGDNEIDYEVAMSLDLNNSSINKSQLNGIEYAIKEKIDMRKEEINKTNITITSKFDDLFPVIESLVNVVSNKIENIDIKKINKQLNSINMKNLVNTYINSEFAKDKRSKVLDEKNKQIQELKEKLNKYTPIY